MGVSTEIKIVVDKLDLIKSELDYIKEHMVEKDEIMNSDEFSAYEKSLNKKNLVSLDDAKKELGF